MQADGTHAQGEAADVPAVFLSYARADRAEALRILDILQDAGFRVWWDGLIPGGERFNASIERALNAAGAVVVLWSRASIASDWVRDEAMHARDRRCLVPLSIDGSEPPLGFRQLHYLDVSGTGLRADSPAMRQAVQAITALLEPGAARDASPRDATRRSPSRRTLLIAGGGGAAALAAGAGGWAWLNRGGSARANSIAVLPFDNVGGDPKQQYFSDGLSAELRAQLARNPLLTVMGQASSNTFRDRGDDSGQAIARRLDVAYLLDGNVRVADGTVRIAVELINGATGFTRWADSFDGPMADVLRLQERIAQAVDRSLSAQLAGAGTEQVARSGGSTSVPAFDAYLRGKALFESQRDEASDRGALARFDDAIRLDPGYAAARAARSRTLAVIANQYSQAAQRKQLYAEAVSEARAAIRDAPQFADGHAALGYALFYGTLDVLAADQPYEASLRLGAGSADVLSRYALYRARCRQFDRALPAIARAVSLDPLNPSVFKMAGLIRYARGDYQGAIASARHALEINPQRATIWGDIGNALLMLGRLDDAAAAFARETAGLLAIPGRAIVAQRRGDTAAATRALAELVAAFGDNGLYQQAQVLAQLGRIEEAVAVLERARDMADSGLVLVLNDPFLAPLQAVPGFRALLHELHFR